MPLKKHARKDITPVSCVTDSLRAHNQKVSSVQGLLRRLIPAHVDLFALQLVNPATQSPAGSADYFSLEVFDGKVHVNGTSCVELASGIHWFLKYFAECSVSWDLTGGVQVSPASPTPEWLAALEGRGAVTIERAVPFSFYQNVVTLSYSMAFWEWDRWEAELDWMALQGINLPLMPLGMEALQVETFTALGLTASQLQDFFPGPAFLAWGRMGNIQGYAGPLPKSYMAKQLALAKRVVQRMREYGMNPVYPAFAGFVPAALAELYPEASLTPASNWCQFPTGYCCPYMLDPCDQLFARIGSTYIRTLREQLGWDASSYYIADSFNEMKPASDSPEYLSGVSASVFAGMTAADPNATWIMQAWLFFSDSRFWQPPQIKALLSGVPQGRLVLLDLFADEHPVWTRTSALYGRPFIWCMLHNFGGNSAMYGALPSVAEGVSAALENDNLVGVGMAPEGIEQNPAVYEFMAEMAYKGRAAAAAASPGGLSSWFRDYARRRYAAAGLIPLPASAALTSAWQLLAHSVYSCRDKLHNTVCDIPTSRPGLSRSEIMGWGLAPHLWYNVNDVRAAWELMLQAVGAAPQLAGSSAFVYDLLDVSRELMSKIAGRLWADAVTAYQSGNLACLRGSGAALTGLLEALDTLLASHKGFLLGPALERARAYACSISSDDAASEEQQQLQEQLASLYEWNLRTQLTIWGTSNAAGDSEVSDYASKEWSGLISSFYLPRWRAWLERLEQDLLLGRPYDAAAWRLEVLMLTYRWISTGSTVDSSSSGSDTSEAMAVDFWESELASAAGACDQSDSCNSKVSAFVGPAVSVQDAAVVAHGDPMLLSRHAYERYGKLVAPVVVSAPGTVMAAAAAAAVVAGAAGAAVAAATAAAPAVSVVEEVAA